MMIIRKIQDTDWPAILAVQERVYIDVPPEPLNVLQDKVRHSKGTCFVCLAGSRLVGYLLSHPWGEEKPPTLHQTLAPAYCDDYIFLHDLAIDSAQKGMGYGKALLAAFWDSIKAKKVNAVRLVAVQDSEGFWQRQGFQVKKGLSVAAGYGDSATLMERLHKNR